MWQRLVKENTDIKSQMAGLCLISRDGKQSRKESLKPNHLSWRSLEVCVRPTTQPRKTNCQQQTKISIHWARLGLLQEEEWGCATKAERKQDWSHFWHPGKPSDFVYTWNTRTMHEAGKNSEWNKALQHLSFKTEWDEGRLNSRETQLFSGHTKEGAPRLKA